MRTLLDQLSQIHGAKFANFTYRSAETGELAKYQVMLGVDMTSLYQKDRETLVAMLPSLDGLQKDAAEALLASIEESLQKGLGNNSAYTHGPDGGDTYFLTHIPGVKLNLHDGVLHVMALVQSKHVLEAGTYKVVNSRPLTLAKRALEREHLRRSKVRQFRLPNIASARLNGETLVFDIPPVDTPVHV
jgi:hypothetical protein